MLAYPGMASVPWHSAVVRAGDCLYLPYEWIHHVSKKEREEIGREEGYYSLVETNHFNSYWNLFELTLPACKQM